MKLKEDKWHFLLSWYKHETMSVCQYWAEQDQGSKKEKLLRVAIDKHFRFEENPTIVYNDYKSPFQKLLELDNSVSICDRNYLNKVKNGL